MKPLNVRFTDEFKLELDDYADQLGVRVSKLSRTAIELGLAELKKFDNNYPGYAKKIVNSK